jgi:hypothetical protein
VVKDAKRSEGEGPDTTQTQCQSHKPRGGPVAQPAANTTLPATGIATRQRSTVRWRLQALAIAFGLAAVAALRHGLRL